MSGSCRPLIFIDTCSLLDSCWNKDDARHGCYAYSRKKESAFWEREFVSLRAIGDVIIPKRNYDELVKHARNITKADLADRSRQVLQRIEQLTSDKKLQIVGDPNDPFADAILLSIALKFRTQRNLAFITQDRGLAEDLQAIRYFRSLSDHKGHPRYDIKIRRINKRGELKPFKGLNAALKERYSSPISLSAPKDNSGKKKASTNNWGLESGHSLSLDTTKPEMNWWDA